ncbi:MAG TPA: zinc ribbon domain-containing protein [Thermomicrobiales bacterium]|nr:zinc ribbon domain-containing protein [Thermomicrobiales bacterium]
MVSTESNPVTCGNCGTENPPGQDFCTNCGQPLTGSADEAIREHIEATEDDGVIGSNAPGADGAVSAVDAGFGVPVDVPDDTLPPRD